MAFECPFRHMPEAARSDLYQASDPPRKARSLALATVLERELYHRTLYLHCLGRSLELCDRVPCVLQVGSPLLQPGSRAGTYRQPVFLSPPRNHWQVLTVDL